MSSKKKTRRPLAISIHGDGLDIEAKFSDSRLADLLTETLKRVTSAHATQSTSADSSPLAEMVGEFGKSLRKDQLELLVNALDMSQKVLFMEIMNTVVERVGN